MKFRFWRKLPVEQIEIAESNDGFLYKYERNECDKKILEITFDDYHKEEYEVYHNISYAYSDYDIDERFIVLEKLDKFINLNYVREYKIKDIE